MYSPAWGWTLEGVEGDEEETRRRSLAGVILWCDEEEDKEDLPAREEWERSRDWMRGVMDSSSLSSSAKLRSLGAWWLCCCGFCLGGGGFFSLVLVVFSLGFGGGRAWESSLLVVLSSSSSDLRRKFLLLLLLDIFLGFLMFLVFELVREREEIALELERLPWPTNSRGRLLHHPNPIPHYTCEIVPHHFLCLVCVQILDIIHMWF